MAEVPSGSSQLDRNAPPYALRLVQIMFRGRPAGLYEVRETERKTVMLASGPIRFPIGARVTIDDFGGVIVSGFGSSLPATVIASDGRCLTLAI